MQLLTQQQIHDLAEILVEEYGPCLTGDELLEHIAMLLEDISGFESAPGSAVDRVITEIGRTYHDAVQQHEAD